MFVYVFFYLFFFFSSRRRHTRLTCDWVQTCALPIWTTRTTTKTTTSRTRGGGCDDHPSTNPALPALPHHPTRLPRRRLHRSEERRVGKECRSRSSPHH